MRKILFLIFFIFISNLSTLKVLAYNILLTPQSPLVKNATANNPLRINVDDCRGCFVISQKYGLWLISPNREASNKGFYNPASINSITINFSLMDNYEKAIGSSTYKIWVYGGGGFDQSKVVAEGSFEIVAAQAGNPRIRPKQTTYQVGNKPRFIIENFQPNQDYTFWWEGYRLSADLNAKAPSSSGLPFEITSSVIINDIGTKTYCMEIGNLPNVLNANCSFSTMVLFSAGAVGGGGTGSCAGIKDPELTKCRQCTEQSFTPRPSPDITGVWTALGCVHTKPEDFVAQLLGWVMGLGGGIAFLLIVWGGFQIVTSSGDPEKLNSGKEIIVSALAGLLMIVFSVILLRIIGVDILKIPGFNK